MIPSKEELMTMPITLLEKSLRPESPAEEREIQQILDMRRLSSPVTREIYRGDIPMVIETPEQEAEIQKKIDARIAKVRGQIIGDQVEPEPVQPEVEPTPEIQPEAKVRFCEFCDSKGVRHKLNCTRSKNV